MNLQWVLLVEGFAACVDKNTKFLKHNKAKYNKTRYACRQENVHRLYANTMAFYLRGFSICRFWYPQGSWKQSPTDTEGWLCLSPKNKNGVAFQATEPVCHWIPLIALDCMEMFRYSPKLYTTSILHICANIEKHEHCLVY